MIKKIQNIFGTLKKKSAKPKFFFKLTFFEKLLVKCLFYFTKIHLQKLTGMKILQKLAKNGNGLVVFMKQ